MTHMELSKLLKQFQDLLPVGETGAIILGSQYLKPETSKMMGLDNMIKLSVPSPAYNNLNNKKSN